MTYRNKWRILQAIDYSFQLACTGIEIKQPNLTFYPEFFVLKFGMNEFFPLNIEEHCNDPFQSMQQIHPDFIFNNSKLLTKLSDKLEKFKDENQYFNFKQID